MSLVINPVESFAAIPSNYLDSLGTLKEQNFDQSLFWYEELSKILLPEGYRLLILLVETHEGTPLAICPLLVMNKRKGLAKPVEIRALANYYTAHFAPIFMNEADVESVSAFIAENMLKRDYHSVDINPVDPESKLFAGLHKGFETARPYIKPYFRFKNWYLQVDGRSYDEYLPSLPKKLRNTLKRKHNKLHREHDAQIRIYTHHDEIEKHFDEYITVYENSWKNTEPYIEFIRTICIRYAQDDALRFGVLYVDARPVAAQIWFLNNNTASIFKLAYVDDYAKLSVGSLLTQQLMRQAMDVDKVEIVDYLCGDDNYKRDWMSHCREQWGLRVYNRKKLANLPEIIRNMVRSRLRPNH